ncbi:MAG: SNF2-related protein, partial [Candidatus Binatia bacterium]
MTAKLSSQVDRRSRERGLSYFLNDAVDLLEGDEWSVDATVQGTRLYYVTISRGEDAFEVSCTCPYHERELLTCKHIWAAFLAAEQEGYLEGLDPTVPVRIEDAGAEIPQKKIKPPPPAKRNQPPAWQHQLHGLRNAMEAEENRARSETLPERELLYFIDLLDASAHGRLTIEVAQREKKLNGDWGKLKNKKIRWDEIDHMPDPADRRIMVVLLGAQDQTSGGHSPYYYDSAASRFTLTQALAEIVLPAMCATGRCYLRASLGAEQHSPVRWDGEDAWELWLKIAHEDGGERYRVTGSLRREGTEMDIAKPAALVPGGVVIYDDQVARLRDFGAFGWISLLRAQGSLLVPTKQAEEFVGELVRLPRQPQLELPNELKFDVVHGRPQPRLRLKPAERHSWQRSSLVGELSFSYDGELIPHGSSGQSIYQKDRRRLIRRDLESEMAAEKRLKALGFRKGYATRDDEFELLPDHLPKVVRALTHEGWKVEAEGKLFRAPGELHIEISSGIDWFELQGGAQFGAMAVPLPQLILAIKRGEQTVRLDDGTLGIVPEEWLKKYALLADLGNLEENRLRFARQQAGLLDALLATEPQVKVDAAFERLRREIRNFSGIKAVDPPANFSGQLRDYQREGLGWLCFLQRFGFGGCLADDMGLGKTVQVLALLESRRELRGGGAPGDAARSNIPSLVVVPRSLVFHWKGEAARFTPKLQILDHTGAARLKPGDHFNEYDLVITTYGTLRRDAVLFKDVRFDYCILDEAQAIKNARTLSAKAARLLRADHRLALSGTPVENHVGELWSLFEFLNPGMLGSASVFRRARNPDLHTRDLLARALRPFILRRTKGQVARELPPKTEQTIYFDLEPREKTLYDELRTYYRARLLK